MAERLEDMLRPGERVLYGAPGSWRPRHWDGLLVFLCVCVACAVGGFILSGVLDFNPAIALGMAVGLAIFLIGFVGFELWDLSSQEAALTDQRLFHNPDRAKPKIVERALDEIQAVEISDYRLAVTTADGQSLVLGHTCDVRELGAALCETLGAPPPPTPRRKARLAQGLFTGVAAGTGLAAAFVLFVSITGASGERFGFWSVALYFLSAAPVGIAAALLGTLLVLVPLRPFLTRLEMQGLVQPARVTFLGPSAPEKRALLPRFYLGFIDWLYVGSTHPEPEGHGNGG